MKMQVYFKRIAHLVVGVVIVSSLCVTYFATQSISLNFVPPTPKNLSIPEQMGSMNTSEVVKPDVSTIIFQPSNPLLKGRHGYKRPFAVIVIISLAKFSKQRESIRSTWGKSGEVFDIRIFFMIGFHDFAQQNMLKALKDEQARYDDIILDNYEEGYYRVSGKILRIMKWFNATYTDQTSPRFFVKADEDVFVNIPNLVSTLESTPYYKALLLKVLLASKLGLRESVKVSVEPSHTESYYVGGKRWTNPKVDTNPASMWYMDSITREKFGWPVHFYPTFLNGPLYAFSYNVVPMVYQKSFDVPLFPFEDVYVPGIIASDRLNLSISDMENINSVITHPVKSPAMMHQLFGESSLVKDCSN